MGVLTGLKVIEMAGIGPGPFAGMLLADMGADVLRIDRPGGGVATFEVDPAQDVLARGRRSVVIDLKQPQGIDAVLDLCTQADLLIEGYRPGVMERLGLGPDACLARNPRLVYGRVTGWGQTGPLAPTAGHDITYLAVAGALHGIGPRDGVPVPPINLVGDYGGGAMLLLVGVLSALWEAGRSGRGQVVDAAMVDGAAQLMTPFHALMAQGQWRDARGSNLLDGGAWFYRCYETLDGQSLAMGPLEPRFFAEFLQRAGLDAAEWPQGTADEWPQLTQRLAALIRTRTRDDWMRVLDGGDACVAPVLSMNEAPQHPHNVARQNFVEAFGIRQPAPAPRYSRTPSAIRPPASMIGADTRTALADWGFDADRIKALCGARA